MARREVTDNDSGESNKPDTALGDEARDLELVDPAYTNSTIIACLTYRKLRGGWWLAREGR